MQEEYKAKCSKVESLIKAVEDDDEVGNKEAIAEKKSELQKLTKQVSLQPVPLAMSQTLQQMAEREE